MTTIDPPQLAGDATELVPVLPDSAWDRFEALLARASDRLNPILVKEARQALRSRQFVITFFLMLIAGWVWSILGLATIGPAVYYSAEGPQMLFVYHMILSFPLLVVAPYSAYHSLAAERQDRTYELVSITALDARQILSGKLGGIMLQMMVYLSAIFPCLAFTYLLRGLDIFAIVLVVMYTCGLVVGAVGDGIAAGGGNTAATAADRDVGAVRHGPVWRDDCRQLLDQRHRPLWRHDGQLRGILDRAECAGHLVLQLLRHHVSGGPQPDHDR